MELTEDTITTTTNTSNYYNWKRYWLPSNISKPDMHANGFMRPRAGYFNGDLKTYHDLSNKNYLLLVGEPGMGKTKFCEQIMDGLQADELNQYWFKELKNITSDYSFDKKLIDKIKEKLENAYDKTNVYVFLDGLDEGLLQHNVIDTNFIEELKNLKEFNKRLKLRITCRTYDLPKDLEKGLKEFYGIERSESNIYTLCPLTEDDVREAASKKNIDADKFIEEIKNKELVPLAIRPITLTFLIGLFNKPEGLPNDIKDIYEAGIEDSIKEKHNELRKKAYTKEDTKKIFLVAARIAYLSILGNKPNLENDDFTGVNEEWNKNQIEVNDKIIEEIFATQVFSKAGDQISFSHKTYAEFLAAYYLQYNNIGIDALKNLFFNDLGKVHPQLKEVAIWLSRYNEEILELIVENDFEILFYKSNIQLDAKAKENIIDAYIKALESGEILNDWRNNLKVLNYEGLDYKIIGEFKKTKHTGTISFLIQLSRFCSNKVKLQNTILDLALALEHPKKDIQIEAINYIAEHGREIAKEQLIEKLKKEDFDDDKNDEMRAALLGSVYDKMDYDELLEYITNEKEPNHWKTYNPFLLYEFCEDLYGNIDHLTKTLIHFSNNIEQKKDVIEKIIGPGLVEAAITNISEVSVEDALVQFIGNRLVLNIPSFEFETFLVHFKYSTKEELDPALKRKFLEKLVYFLFYEKELEDLKIIEKLTYEEEIIGKEELNWVFENFENEKNKKLKDFWFKFIKTICCISRQYSRKELTLLENLDKLYQIYRSTKYVPFKYFYSNLFEGVEIKSDYAKKLKNDYEFRQECSPKQADEEKNEFLKKLNKWVQDEIVKIKSGEINHWVCLTKNITWHTGWEKIEEKNQKGIIEAAKIYLGSIENKCNCNKLIFGKDCTHDFRVGRAFSLLMREAKDYLENQPKSFFDNWVDRMVANKSARNINLIKLFLNKTTHETIKSLNTQIEYFSELKTKSEDDKKNFGDFVYLIMRIKNQHISKILYKIIVNENKLTNTLSDDTTYHIINKLLKEEYAPILENIQSWSNQLINKQHYEKLSGIFSSAFSYIKKNRDVLGTIVQKFLDDTEFEDYFIEESVSTDKLEYDKFCYKLNKLTKKTCEKWLNHLDKRYPQKKNSILGKSKIAELKEYLLSNIIQKSKDFEIISYYNKLKSKFKEKEEINIINFEIIRAKESLSQRCWQPLTPKALLEIAKENKRSIQTEKQLQDLVLQKLKEIQEDFKKNRPHLESLWNTVKGQEKPKSEDQISDYIKLILEPKLKDAIANRETKVGKQEGSGWGRVDFSIDLKEDGKGKLTVLVEAKGDFYSKDVVKPLQEQLKANYTERNPSNHGIYLVYYTGNKKYKNFEDCQNIFKKEANEQSNENHHIKSFVLDITFEQDWDVF